MSKLDGAVATVTNDGWGHMDGWSGGGMWLWGIAMMATVVVLISWLARAPIGDERKRRPRTSKPTVPAGSRLSNETGAPSSGRPARPQSAAVGRLGPGRSQQRARCR